MAHFPTVVGRLPTPGQQVGVNGAIGYATRPKVRFTPFNKNNKETDGYQGAFNKLTTAGISLTEPTADASQNGRDGVTKMLVSSGMTVGTPHQGCGSRYSRLYFRIRAGCNGSFPVWKEFERPGGAFYQWPQFHFDIGNRWWGQRQWFTPCDMEPTGVELRYGRWNMESQSGPETMGLSLLSQAEYWTGSTFSLNTSDNCTDLSSAISILEMTGDLVAIPVSSGTSDFSYSGPLSGGMGSFTLPPTGTNNTGSLTVKVDLSGYSLASIRLVLPGRRHLQPGQSSRCRGDFWYLSWAWPNHLLAGRILRLPFNEAINLIKIGTAQTEWIALNCTSACHVSSRRRWLLAGPLSLATRWVSWVSGKGTGR